MIKHFQKLGKSYNILANDRFPTGIRPFPFESENEGKRRRAIQEGRIGKVPSMVDPTKPKVPRSASSTQSQPVSVKGTTYSSLNEAAKAIGWNRQTIKKYCTSTDPEYADWFFINEANKK